MYKRSALPCNAEVQIKKRVQSKLQLNNQVMKLSISQGGHEFQNKSSLNML